MTEHLAIREILKNIYIYNTVQYASGSSTVCPSTTRSHYFEYQNNTAEYDVMTGTSTAQTKELYQPEKHQNYRRTIYAHSIRNTHSMSHSNL